MELQQLRYVIALSDELHFTRAAARANVAQPALSRSIRRLEDELQAPLFDRTSRSVRMTDQGLAFVERVRRAVAELDEARATVTETVQLLRGRLTIGLTPTPGPLNIPGLLGAFHAAHPGVELACREELSLTLADRLRRDELEVAFISGIGTPVRERLTLRQLAAERLVVILSGAHPRAGGTSVELRDLEAESFIAFPDGATIRDAVTAAAGRAGFIPRIGFETHDVNRARALVAQGLGVAVVPESDVRTPGPPVVAVPIAGQELTHEVFVAWRSNRRLTSAARALIQLAERAWF